MGREVVVVVEGGTGSSGAGGRLVRPCLTSLGLVESAHGRHSTNLIGHLPLINHYEPSF